jgi:hypothetical protein
MDENKPRRRWLRFGIRDLLWAMALLAMALAWWVDRSELKAKSERYMGVLLKLRTLGLDTSVIMNRPDIGKEVEDEYRARNGMPPTPIVPLHPNH